METDLDFPGRSSRLHRDVGVGFQFVEVGTAFVSHIHAKVSPEKSILIGIFVVIESRVAEAVSVGFFEDSVTSDYT